MSRRLTGSPRTAADPAHALLNDLYALLEAEARIAGLAVGLDPGLGVLHADLKARDLLALDPLGSRVVSRDDVFETRQGAAGCCRR